MKKLDFCPECSIELSNMESLMGFCENCKANWDVEDEPEHRQPPFMVQSEQLCGWFLPDSEISSATRCQRCGREKWEHPETI